MIRDEKPKSSGWAKAIIVGLVCLAAGVAFGRRGTSPKAGAEQAWKDVDTLNQMYMVPSSYNFIETNKSYEGQLLSLIHDHLLQFDPVQNLLVPALAKKYEVSPDGLTWTFHLRDAKNPDGAELTADDVVFSFNLCLDERFDCKKRGNFVIKGKPIVAKAVDPHTVTFQLPEPFHSFPFPLSDVFIVPRAVFEKVAASETSFREAVGVQAPDPKYLRGFGPYYVEKQDTQEARLIRNDKFWGRGDDQSPRPAVRQINLVLRKDNVTNEIDFVRDNRYAYRQVAPREAERLQADPRFQVLDRGRGAGCLFFWLNQNPRAPWGKTHPDRMSLVQKVDFRRAIGHAIDRYAIIRRVYKGFAEPLYGPVSPVFRWAAPSEELEEVTPKFDRKAALEELAKLGIKPGEKDASGKAWLTYMEGGKPTPLEIEIRTSKDEEDQRRRTAEEIKAQLEEIGLRVKIVEEPFGEMVKRLDQTYDYEAAVMVLEGMPDAAVLRYFFESSGPMHFVNPYQKTPATDWEKKVDELYNTYATSPDPVARDRAILDVQRTWVAAQPAFHLLNARKLVAVRREFEINGLALTGRAIDPILQRTVIENIKIRRLEDR
ncbi:ABC transporter substrate-binding protein [Singulisphaera sp. PoT]|uniref:ABC transporter substrate-binding protein n=1 Tax=Singulisphaera sp. PoT TaxID=3411797 RepID=UPI003BF59DCB